MDPIPSEVIERGKALLKDTSCSRGSVGNQYYGFIGKEKKYDSGIKGPNPCYGNTTLYVNKEHIIMLDKSIALGNFKNFKNYSNYCLNKSVFNHVFITKDIEEIMELGGTILDVRYSGQEVISGAISLRYLSEQKEDISTWNFMVENGLNEDIAFILMNFYTINCNKLIINMSNFGHSWLNYHPKEKQYKTLFNNIYKRIINKRDAFNISKKYLPTDHIFIEAVKDDIVQYLYYGIEKNFLYKGRETIYTNSLGKIKKELNGVGKEDLPELEKWFLSFIGE